MDYVDASGSRWTITKHALDRYAERVGDGLLLDRLGYACRLGRKARKRVLRRYRAISGRDRLGAYPHFYLQSDERAHADDDGEPVIFVCEAQGDRMVLITCFRDRDPETA